LSDCYLLWAACGIADRFERLTHRQQDGAIAPINARQD
jgi:hypothetical protein